MAKPWTYVTVKDENDEPAAYNLTQSGMAYPKKQKSPGFNVNVSGVDDAKSADVLTSSGMASVKTKKRKKKRPLTSSQSKYVTSLFEQLNDALKPYDEENRELALGEYWALLAEKERQASAGEHGGVGLRRLDNIREDIEDDIRENTSAMNEYTEDSAKLLADAIYKGNIDNARRLINDIRSGKKKISEITVYR